MSSFSDRASAGSFIASLKPFDTSGVELGNDDDQIKPSVDVNSPQEANILSQMDVSSSESHPRYSKDLALMCLRGRKYDPARASELLPNLLLLLDDIDLQREKKMQLVKDIQSKKVIHDRKIPTTAAFFG